MASLILTQAALVAINADLNAAYFTGADRVARIYVDDNGDFGAEVVSASTNSWSSDWDTFVTLNLGTGLETLPEENNGEGELAENMEMALIQTLNQFVGDDLEAAKVSGDLQETYLCNLSQSY